MRLVHLASSPSLPPAASGVSATAAAAAAALVLVILSCAVAPAGGCHSRHHHDFRDQTEAYRQSPMMQEMYPYKFSNASAAGSQEEASTRVKRSSFRTSTDRQLLSNQISSILDQLFSNGYDVQLRPGLGVKPLDVSVNVVVRSMGPVDEQKETFSLDCYFRQFWVDDRLRYNTSAGGLKELPMNWQFLYKIWRPDTFIVNGQKSYLHKITVPNRFIRIAPDGTISYSQRLTVKARCQMDLHKFPLDAQECPLEIGSFGHSSSEVTYRWLDNAISLEDEIKKGLAQYHLVNWTHSEFTGVRKVSGRNVSTVIVKFKFQRQQGFYLLQIYIPLTLIVMCSWVTFWLTKTEKGSEIPARTGLGASSVLSVVTIGFGGKSKPQVGYATALDVFIVLCFVNVFAALIEFAFLNFLDTLVRRIKRKEKENKIVSLMAQHHVMGSRMPKIPERQESMMDTDGIMTDEDLLTPPGEEDSTPNIQQQQNVFNFNGTSQEMVNALNQQRDCGTRILDGIIGFFMFFYCCRSVRRIFPLTFLLVNCIYWWGYSSL